MRTWQLRDRDGNVVVPGVEGTAEELLVVVEAANAKQTATAPHYATSGGAEVRSEEAMDAADVDEVLARVGEGE